MITGVRNLEDKEVCYGMVNGNILAYKVPKPDDKARATLYATKQWPVFKVALSRNPERGLTIECIDPHGVKFGNIEESLAVALAPAMDEFPNFRTQCRMITRPTKVMEFVHQPTSDHYRVIINLYGRKGDVHKVGRWFGQKNIWFRSPMVSDAGIEVINPHAQKRVVHETVAKGHGVTSTTRTVEEAVDAVSRLFDHQAEGAEIAETETPDLIITPLLSHQKQALTFMLRQEQPRTYSSEEGGNSSLWRKKINRRGQEFYEEVVTGISVQQEPKQVLGGLLADVMGLGKTLSALSLIVSTMSEAAKFSQMQLIRKDESETDLALHSRATLLMAPVSTVKNWEDQITDHIQPGAVKHYIYHGQNRDKNPFKLADNDVVITTYSTAAAEIFGGRAEGTSPLRRIRWFRIILDEAHTIRESKSSQARAMHSLFAERRWCLTGTPIQNRMEDLGSLTTFLKLYPYDTLAKFNQYIAAPMRSGDPTFLKRLRVFVDSFTLRRLRDRIDLPKRQDLIVDLEFSLQERAVHDFFRERFQVNMKHMIEEVKRRGTGAQFSRVLQGITVLRLVCDHGKELLKQEQLEELKGSTADEPVDLEQEQRLPELTKRKAYEHFNMMAEADMDICALCGRQLTGDSPAGEIDGATEGVQAVVLPCLDVFCAECFEPCKTEFEKVRGTSEEMYCPNARCNIPIGAQYVTISKSHTENLHTAPDDTTGAADNAFKNGYYGGPHTKTKQLLHDITQMKEESILLVENGELPLKCVVFSEFTSHLDLIGKALSDRGHTFVRIDGSMTLANRRKVIDALNTDNNVQILLASIKAAGQGLNLTAASRAFIMEPMWNPAAEAQAVDRIYRIGQKREVVVRRYRMKNSMEDQIVKLQDKKKKLAEMSMEKQAMQQMLSKKERHEENLKAMLDIFRA